MQIKTIAEIKPKATHAFINAFALEYSYLAHSLFTAPNIENLFSTLYLRMEKKPFTELALETKTALLQSFVFLIKKQFGFFQYNSALLENELSDIAQALNNQTMYLEDFYHLMNILGFSRRSRQETLALVIPHLTGNFPQEQLRS